MALRYQRIRGTRDILPIESTKWQYVERMAMEVSSRYGFGELRIPTFEKTDLFTRSVGESTDVVQKEMYTFEKGRDSITLRPEGTAGVIRAILENGMLNEATPQKLSYFTSCFRHENPQAGRLREFHQFGCECVGTASASQDAEMIAMVYDFLTRLGLKEFEVQVNSIGCPECRPTYNSKLVEYYRAHYDVLCDTCKQRLEKNPMRLLDCKSESCSALKPGAPRSLDSLCEECENHFVDLKERLCAMGIPHVVNPDIVRGLDYYTRTVFEFITTCIGAQGAIGGGGRYDGLIAQMGAPTTPALGFAMGLERILMLMDAEGCEFPNTKQCDIYVGSMGGAENITAQKIVSLLRLEGFYALCDTVERSVKAQIKYADRQGARYACVIGSNELEAMEVVVKDMRGSSQYTIKLDAPSISRFLYDMMAEEVADTL